MRDKDGPAVSRAVAVVALMALSKREFFRRLLDDPRGALEEVQAELELGPDDIDEVVGLVAEASRDMKAQQALELWDDWRARGIWGDGHWPEMSPHWPIWRDSIRDT